jgi:hypothetical protein
MSSPIALQPAPFLPNAAAAVASPVVTILDGAAQALATLSEAAQISGTVAPSETPGEITLVTVLGTLALKTSLALPEGTQIVLQAIADRPGSATIVTINDAPLAARASTPAPAATAPPPAIPPPPAVLALGTTISAIVIDNHESRLPDSRIAQLPTAAPTTPPSPGEPLATSPAAAGRAAALPAQAPPQAPQATGPLARLAALAAAAGRVLPELRAGQTATVPAGTTATAAQSPAAVPRAETFRLAAPGSNLALRILAVQPAAVAGSLAAPALGGVVRPSPPGLAGMLIETPSGLLRLYPDAAPATERQASPIAPGTPVALRLLAGAPPAALLTVLTKPAPAAAAEPTTEPEKAPSGKAAAAATPKTPGGLATPAPPQGAAGASPLARPAIRMLLNAPAPAASGPQQAAGSPGAMPLMVGSVVTANAGATSTATLIATPLGTLAVNEPVKLPPDTLLLLTAPADDTSAPDAPAGTAPSRFDKSWSALGATLTALGHAAPELAAHLRADLSTQSGERLAASLVVLVAALRNNTPRLWPGEAIEHALGEAGHEDIKLKLGAEFAEISRLADNPATSPWQVFLLPLIDGPTVRPVRLYLKRRGERGRRSAEDDHSRFVLEFELTRLGLLQLDGFVRPQRFDLVLRSHAVLAPPLRSAVERIFYDRVGAAGIAGSIDFAAAARFDVAPLDNLRERIGLAV